MGLDTTHECWHGSYSAFGRWRTIVARMTLGIDLDEMEGFRRSNLGGELDWRPISWDPYTDFPIVKLLNHSDCDGEILAEDCLAIAEDLEVIMPQARRVPPGWGHLGRFAQQTQRWIDGLKLAAANGENVVFS